MKAVVLKGKDEDIEKKINWWINSNPHKEIKHISLSNNGMFPCIFACILYEEEQLSDLEEFNRERGYV